MDLWLLVHFILLGVSSSYLSACPWGLNAHVDDLSSTPACHLLDCFLSTRARLSHVHMRPHHHPWPYHNRILDFKLLTLTTISYPSSSFALVTIARSTAISRLHYFYHFSLFISSLLFSLPSLLSLEKSLLLQLLSSYTFNKLACVSPSLSLHFLDCLTPNSKCTHYQPSLCRHLSSWTLTEEKIYWTRPTGSTFSSWSQISCKC